VAKLNAVQVRALSEPGRHPVGEGLILCIKPGKPGQSSGGRSWLYRIQSGGTRREYGLGSARDVTLAEAREAAAVIRKQARAGLDPLAEKRKVSARMPTFRDAAAAVHIEHAKGWKNSKHHAQWIATLETYAFPTLGDLTVDCIESGAVRDVLGPIWLDKPETARRVRQRIGTVLDYAVGKGWRAHPLAMESVTKALPRQPRRDGRFEAMPFGDVPAFVTELRAGSSMGRLALEAVILTAARSGELRGARWDELDLDGATWTVPAERMKAGRAHIVPLSPAALDVFCRAAALRLAGSDLVFPGAIRGRPLSDMTLLKVLRDSGRGVTVHGFRSAFRDWAAERTNVAGEVAEAALAHAVPNRVEAAYRRTDFLAKRRNLMDRWGAFVVGEAGKVVRLAARG
jgi:integrase